MRFRTEYVTERGRVIDPERPTVLLGSCFADNLGERMRRCLWEAENPAGTLFNPLSIASALDVMLSAADRFSGESVTSDSPSVRYEEGIRRFRESLFERDGVWLSWLFNSKLSGRSREEITERFMERAHRLDNLLSRAEVMFVTFGTAWCYWLDPDVTGGCRDTASGVGQKGCCEPCLVANCHKQPAKWFERRRLTAEEIVEVWRKMLLKLRRCYPGLRVVFTVSPVRHLKDGFEGNARSKAILLLATEQLCGGFSRNGMAERCNGTFEGSNDTRGDADVEYFPAYEIVNDDLRDYRFYAGDLVHPSEEAVEYLWELFRKRYIDERGEGILKAGEAEYKRRAHRTML